LSLLLAVIGAYGIVADTVLVRRRELAIRLVLGATGTKAIRLVVGQVLTTFVAAVALSIPLLVVTKRVLSAWLYGVSAVDPVTWGIAAAIVGTAVGLGAYLPSRRAASMNPAQTLRC
jgi:putative ABC transport system permease protein